MKFLQLLPFHHRLDEDPPFFPTHWGKKPPWYPAAQFGFLILWSAEHDLHNPLGETETGKGDVTCSGQEARASQQNVGKRGCNLCVRRVQWQAQGQTGQEPSQPRSLALTSSSASPSSTDVHTDVPLMPH